MSEKRTKSERPPVNKYVKEYSGKLATHHIELKDPDNPEAGNVLVPNAELPGHISLTDGVPIVTENIEEP